MIPGMVMILITTDGMVHTGVVLIITAIILFTQPGIHRWCST